MSLGIENGYRNADNRRQEVFNHILYEENELKLGKLCLFRVLSVQKQLFEEYKSVFILSHMLNNHINFQYTLANIRYLISSQEKSGSINPLAQKIYHLLLDDPFVMFRSLLKLLQYEGIAQVANILNRLLPLISYPEYKAIQFKEINDTIDVQKFDPIKTIFLRNSDNQTSYLYIVNSDQIFQNQQQDSFPLLEANITSNNTNPLKQINESDLKQLQQFLS